MAFFPASGRRLLLLHHLRRALSTTSTPIPPHPVPRADLRRLARAGRHADIDALLTPHLPTHPAAVLHSFSSHGMLDRATRALSSLPSPSPSHLNALLLPLLRLPRRAHLVPSLVSSFSPNPIPPDASTFGILAKSLCLTSSASSALHLLDQMKPPSLVLFTTLIDSFYKESRPADADALWTRMVRDEGLAPDLPAYNARATYIAARGSVAEVEALVAEMREEAGLAPDAITFNCVMGAMARHGRLREAVAVYKGMEGEGCAPNCATYRLLVAALCKGGRVAKAEEVLRDGVRRGKVADLGTVKLLVEEMAKKGKGVAARRVVGSLKKKFPEDFVGSWTKLERIAEKAAKEEEEEEENKKVPSEAHLLV